MDRARFTGTEYVKMMCWSASGMDKPTVEEGMQAAMSSGVRPIEQGHLFGPSWSNHWVKVELTIPPNVGDDVICKSYPPHPSYA